MSGSIRKVTLQGRTFPVASDANLTQNPDKEVTGIPTSGRTTFSSKKVVASVEGCDLILTPAEFVDLKELDGQDITMSYEEETGDVWRAEGRVSIMARETETGKTPIKMIPTLGWKAFLA